MIFLLNPLYADVEFRLLIFVANFPFFQIFLAILEFSMKKCIKISTNMPTIIPVILKIPLKYVGGKKLNLYLFSLHAEYKIWQMFGKYL